MIRFAASARTNLARLAGQLSPYDESALQRRGSVDCPDSQRGSSGEAPLQFTDVAGELGYQRNRFAEPTWT